MVTISDQYEITDQNSPIKTAVIKLKNSEYDGYTFYFGTVNFGNVDNVEETEKVRCSYEFFTIDNSVNIDTSTVDFSKHLGDILVDICEKDIENDRTNNTE